VSLPVPSAPPEAAALLAQLLGLAREAAALYGTTPAALLQRLADQLEHADQASASLAVRAALEGRG
jgi:hypothetical protein